MKKEYGLVIGRFQPFHFGHQHIINEILLDGKIPVIMIGAGGNVDKNPLSSCERRQLIEIVYPTECKFITVYDCNDWDAWLNNIILSLNILSILSSDVTLYYHNKEVDRYDHFKCFGKDYYNAFYTDIFTDTRIATKEVEFVKRSDIHVAANATNIRDNFEGFKHLLDGRIYHQLKKWGWK